MKHSKESPSHCSIGRVVLYGSTVGQMYVDLGVELVTAVRTPDKLKNKADKRYFAGECVILRKIASYILCSGASASLGRFR